MCLVRACVKMRMHAILILYLCTVHCEVDINHKSNLSINLYCFGYDINFICLRTVCICVVCMHLGACASACACVYNVWCFVYVFSQAAPLSSDELQVIKAGVFVATAEMYDYIYFFFYNTELSLP